MYRREKGEYLEKGLKYRDYVGWKNFKNFLSLFLSERKGNYFLL